MFFCLFNLLSVIRVLINFLLVSILLFLISILLLVVIIIVKIAINLGLKLRLGDFSILVVCCLPIITEEVVLFFFFLIKRFLISVVGCLTRMLLNPSSVMIMDKLPIFILIIGSSFLNLRLRTIGAIKVLVVTPNQKVIGPRLCTHRLRMFSMVAISPVAILLFKSTTPLKCLSPSFFHRQIL